MFLIHMDCISLKNLKRIMEDNKPIVLTNGFFQSLLSNTLPEEIQPILQVIEARVMLGAKIVRMRLSDGLFSYSNCAGSLDLGLQLEDEGFMDSRGIIQVTDFTTSMIGDKIVFSIISFKPLQKASSIIGEPKPYSGILEDFKGIENFPVVTNTNAQPVSRKRGLVGQANTDTPSKRQNTMPGGGVFSDGLLNIAMVNPYVSKFRVCGVATFKGEPRWINVKRGGKEDVTQVCSFVLTDVAGNSIKISAFGNECEIFSDIVQKGAAFYVTCIGDNVVRGANHRFNDTGHTYEITLNSQCSVEPCTDRNIGIPVRKLNCIPLIDVKNHPNECVDVLVVVDKVSDIGTVKVKATQADLNKREVTLIDDSCAQVQFTLWGDSVNKITPDQVGTVFGIKGASVREFNGEFSLSSGPGSAIVAAPEGEKAQKLSQWFSKKRSII